ncbi:MAG: hypothetical protein HYT20_00985 [Candidatus Nealsonbacteria bacterium]|nr:hypothetical protein [Candidatus Nealsonbacteria bacterium]
MIPIVLNKAISGRKIIEAIADIAEGQGWQVERFSEIGLAPGSVKKVEINRGLMMRIPLGERQTRFSRVQEELIVDVDDLGENDIRTIGIEVSISQDRISRIAPRDNKKRIAMMISCFMAATAGLYLPLFLMGSTFNWWVVSLGIVSLFIFFVPAVLTIGGGGRYDVLYLDSQAYKRVEPKINALLLSTFSQLGQH